MTQRKTLPEPGTTNDVAGFVVYTNEAIFGTGLTVQDALLDAREWLDPETDPETDPDIKVSPATQALLDEVEREGGAIAWGEVNHVLCTVAEAEGC